MKQSTTNRRAIVPEFMLTNIMPSEHKQKMKMFQARQELTNASYLANRRYTITQTAIPVFQDATRTDAVQPSKDFASKIAKSSFKHVYERVQAAQQNAILQGPPRTAEEWQYATRGLIS